MRAFGVWALAAMAAVVWAQDGEAKKPAKERLPIHWKDLDLTEAQKAKYRQLAAETEKKKDQLSADIDAASAKLKELKASLKRVDSGERYAADVLTKEQLVKLAGLKAKTAKGVADKAAKKAEKAEKKSKDVREGNAPANAKEPGKDPAGKKDAAEKKAG